MPECKEECEENVARALAGQLLTPDECAFVSLYCGVHPSYMIVHSIKFNRASTKLRSLFITEGCENDGELWEVAFKRLADLMDPIAALIQARADLAGVRKAKADAAAAEAAARIVHNRTAATRAQIPGGGRKGGSN